MTSLYNMHPLHCIIQISIVVFQKSTTIPTTQRIKNKYKEKWPYRSQEYSESHLLEILRQ